MYVITENERIREAVMDRFRKKISKDIFIGTIILFAVFLLAACGKKEVSADVLLSDSLLEAVNGNWEKSAEFSSAVLAKDKNNIHALILQALAMHNTDRLQEAMENISAAVKLAPANFHAQYLQGFFAYKAGRYKDAVRPLTMAQNLKPDDLNTLILLAQTHYTLKNDRLAVSLYKKMALHPKYKNSALPVNALGILFARSNPALAERYFQEAERRTKVQGHPLTTLNKAIFYEGRRNKKQSVALYRKFISETKGKAAYDPLRKQVLQHIGSL